MSTNPLDFVTSFLKQPYPTMGLAPSSTIIHTGGTVVQAGDGRDGIGKTGATMWARISSAIPFGWTLGGVQQAAKGISIARDAVVQKTGEGAQAVNGVVKSISDTVKATVAYSKWVIIAIVAVAFIVFAAQVKTLVKT